MRHITRTVVLAGALALAFASQAVASCYFAAYSVPLQNETVDVRPVVRGSCHHSLQSTGIAVFKALNVVSKPAHGTLQVLSPYSARYTARPGFHGEDAYALRFCGFNRGAEGCTIVRYRARVL